MLPPLVHRPHCAFTASRTIPWSRFVLDRLQWICRLVPPVPPFTSPRDHDRRRLLKFATNCGKGQ